MDDKDKLEQAALSEVLDNVSIGRNLMEDITTILRDDPPDALFLICFYPDKPHQIFISQNMKFRGLAQFMRGLAVDYEKAADARGEPATTDTAH